STRPSTAASARRASATSAILMPYSLSSPTTSSSRSMESRSRPPPTRGASSAIDAASTCSRRRRRTMNYLSSLRRAGWLPGIGSVRLYQGCGAGCKDRNGSLTLISRTGAPSMNGEHAHPFRFLDRVVDGPLDRRVVIKAVTAGERAPEALVFEAMAQAALPLAGPRHAAGVPGMLVAIHEARLLRAVGPGDRLRISARVTERFGDLVRVRSQADVEGV